MTTRKTAVLMTCVSAVAMLASLLIAPPAQATVIGTHQVHSTVYPIRFTITGRAALTNAQYTALVGNATAAGAWWNTQTDGHLTFAVSAATCSATGTAPLQWSAVKAAAAACGIADTPLNVPVAMYVRGTEAFAAATSMSPRALTRGAWPADPDYTRRTASSPVQLPTPQLGVDLTRAMEHEFGHVLCLDHATSLHPTGTGATTNLDFRWVSNSASTITDYGDRNDVMGRGNALSDPDRVMLDVQRTGAQYVPPGALPPAGVTLSVASGGSVSWDDNTGPGAGLDTFTYSMDVDGDPQVSRLQRTSFTANDGSTFWTHEIYSLDPGTDVISHLAVGTTYATGDRHIKPLSGSQVLITN